EGNWGVEIEHVAIDEAEASGRHRAADGLRLIGAVDAIDGGAKIESARAHGIAGASGHEAGQVRLPLDHFRRRSPVGPFLLARDVQEALPLKAFAADADPVAQRTPARLNYVEKSLGRLNNDRAGSLIGAIKNDLAPKLRRQLVIVGLGNDPRFLTH